MPQVAPLSGELRNCVVCGLGSHRTDWVKRTDGGGTLYVACDSHTDQEMQAAVNAAKNKPKAEAAPASAGAPAAPASDALKQAAANAAKK